MNLKTYLEKKICFHCNPGTLHAKILKCEETLFGSSWFSVLMEAGTREQL